MGGTALLFLALLFYVNNCQQVPTRFPGTWHTWVVTTVKRGDNPIPIYDDGRLIMFDGINGVTCRYLEENLVNISNARGFDYCDYNSGKHYFMDDNSPTSECSGILQLTAPLAVLVFPQDFIRTAKFLGVDPVGKLYCNHFYAENVLVGSQYEHMDVWVEWSTGLPCQISTVNPLSKELINWAFDGFTTIIPDQAVAQCSIPLIMCAKKNWLCKTKPGAPAPVLARALDWTCGEGKLDCSPILPGGDHFYPDTLIDHCNWAFNQYFVNHRNNQGIAACNFGGAAELVQPNANMEAKPNLSSQQSIFSVLRSFDFEDDSIFPYDLACSD